MYSVDSCGLGSDLVNPLKETPSSAQQFCFVQNKNRLTVMPVHCATLYA